MVLGLRKSNTGREGADECAVSSVIPAVVRNSDGFADDVEQLGELVQIGIGVTEEGNVLGEGTQLHRLVGLDPGGVAAALSAVPGAA